MRVYSWIIPRFLSAFAHKKLSAAEKTCSMRDVKNPWCKWRSGLYILSHIHKIHTVWTTFTLLFCHLAVALHCMAGPSWEQAWTEKPKHHPWWIVKSSSSSKRRNSSKVSGHIPFYSFVIRVIHCCCSLQIYLIIVRQHVTEVVWTERDLQHWTMAVRDGEGHEDHLLVNTRPMLLDWAEKLRGKPSSFFWGSRGYSAVIIRALYFINFAHFLCCIAALHCPMFHTYIKYIKSIKV